ncbi:protein root primordium defective 1 [Phtheirospermum japonicum]|uniref:Protein root primordium defective 1 n=1 Tax=Phtheirospermum japonicum TaxID=374723 RepID=A0A830CEE5_9LAMI|nr:protein root primordium defective 1 [Phtheirospermum japonicum]
MQSKFSALPIFQSPNPKTFTPHFVLQFAASISSLKVVWRKDPKLDQAIENDKKWRLCARVIREVLNEPGQVIPLRYFEKRRERLRLPIKIETFIAQNPGLFDTYKDRIRPKSDLVTFIRPSDRLNRFLEEEQAIYEKNEPLIVEKLCKLLMMAKNNIVSADKLIEAKREFGFPNDFLVKLIPKYPEYFKLHGSPGEGQSYLELVNRESEFSKSVIEKRADDESKLTGIRIRPAFVWKLPPGFFIKKEMREWVRDWNELPYVSPYDDISGLTPNSPEMEKRMVGVFHELLSLSIHKRIPVPILGKFCDEYIFSNAFSSVFTRHSGIFYMSLKGGIKTAVLREAYKGEELVDCDPILEIKNKFIELINEGHEERDQRLRVKRDMIQKDMELMADRNKELGFDKHMAYINFRRLMLFPLIPSVHLLTSKNLPLSILRHQISRPCQNDILLSPFAQLQNQCMAKRISRVPFRLEERSGKSHCPKPVSTHDFHNKIKPVVAIYESLGLSRPDLISVLLAQPTLIPRTTINDDKIEYIR